MKCKDNKYIEKMIQRSNELMNITRDEVNQYKDDVNQKIKLSFWFALPISLIINALITCVLLGVFHII